MLLRSPAKINLALDILKKDPSGYHQIRTVFYEVADLYDEIELTEQKAGLAITCDYPEVPIDERNTVYQAVKLLQENFGIQAGLKISIHKKIPPGSGLGGGSSNAAAVLKGLNQLWNINLSRNELLTMAAQIGMDVPFFIQGGTALGEHYGEKIRPLPNINLPVKINLPNIVINTKSAYEAINLVDCGKNTDKTEKIITAIKNQDMPNIAANIHNDFASMILERHPIIWQTKEKLYKQGYKTVCLSGSGGALFYI